MDGNPGRNATFPASDRFDPPSGRWDPTRHRERTPLHPSASFAAPNQKGAATAKGSGGLLAPVVRDLFRAMAARKLSCMAMGRATGLHHRTFEEWRTGRNPGLRQLTAALAVVGLHLEVTPDPAAPDA